MWWRVTALVLTAQAALAGYHTDNSIANDNGFERSWTYKCMPNQGCQRVEEEELRANVSHYPLHESIDVCRLTCGRDGSLWPQPQTVRLGSQTVKIHPNFIRFNLEGAPLETHSILDDMTAIFNENLLAECGGNVTETVVTSVTVYLTVHSTSLQLTWDTNESYNLDVHLGGEMITVRISAETVYGARHGLESLSQLIAGNRPEYSDRKQCGLHLVSRANIQDKPVYRHRGFLLDTSRNFFPMEDIKRSIDGMAAAKMNVFHWHVTDSHSFPLETPSVPQLTRYGAYSASQVYTVEEVKDLVRYARTRGIRVVVEIDSPAHAGNGWQWGQEYGLGDLAVCVNAQPWRSLCVQPPCGQLNPANAHTMRMLQLLYRDLAAALPAPRLLHVGGDEVFYPCWNSSSEIRSYMASKGMEPTKEGFIALWGEFHQKALNAWDEESKRAGSDGNEPVMIWSSELTQAHRIQNYLDKNRYVIEVWEEMRKPLLDQLLQLGYRVVSVPKDIWYLDHGFWGETRYSNWRRMYSHMLPRSPLALGGEVAMWGELVDSQTLDGRVWPRAAAVAERLWSDPNSLSDFAEPRLQRLRARLIARGLRPDVISPGWCSQHDMKCK